MSQEVTIKKSTYNQILVGIVVLAVALSFAGGYILGGAGSAPSGAAAQQPQQPAQQQPQQPAAGGKVSFTLPSYAPYRGSSSAGLNIIEFADYQCPFCERFYTQTEPSIIRDYVDTNKAKYYFLDFAFLGPDSQTLGQGAWCANDQNKYYEYNSYVYSHQGQENSGWATADKVKAFAGNITGLDTTAFATCLDSGKYQQRVAELTQLGQSAGVSGTPTTLIGTPSGGYTLVVGAQPYANIKPVIDQALA